MHLHRSRWTYHLVLVLCVGMLAAPRLHAQQQQYTIQGTVVDGATQRPLSSVSVQLRGTQQGTLTDNAGRYTLIARVPPGTYTLQYSLIGRGQQTQEITLGTQTAIQLAPVTLQETALQLEGIVVTGTGAPVERRALGNTVATVGGREVNEAPAAPAIDAALQGRVAGAVITQNHGQPGGGVSIRLRGTSSILGGAEPLIVVDGVIIDNNAGALVSLGANAGRGDAGFSNRLADIAPADIDRIEILKGAAAAALYGSRANNGVIQIFTRRGQEGRPRVSFRSEVMSSAAPRRYELNESPVAGRGDVVYGRRPDGAAYTFGEPATRYLYQDQIFQRGVGTTNQLSVSGGAEDTRYYLSGYWTDETGIIRGTGHDNVNARASLSQRLASWIEVSAGGNYIQTSTNYMREGEQTDGGVLTGLIFTPTTWNPAFDPNLGRHPYNPLAIANPLDVIENWNFEQNVNRFIGSLTTTLTPLPNLTITHLFGFDRGNEEFVAFQPIRSVSATDQGLVQNPVRNIRRMNNDVTANHEWDYRPGLRLTTTLGFRNTDDLTNEVRAATGQLPPGQVTLGGATQFASQALTQLRTVSGFVQERVGLNNRFFLTGGLNWDASSAFGEDQRWQLFPRLGASWVVNEEPFWAGTPLDGFVSTLRLRASYGETGGQPPGAYLRLDNYNNVGRGGLAGLVPSTIAGNPNLRPERQREYEGGFELGVLDDRASVEFTYYDQRTSDLVLGVPLALTTGYTTQFQNIGALRNRGVEISLNTVNVQTPGLTWRSTVNYAANRERVEQLAAQNDSLAFGYFNFVMVGQPVGVFYARYFPRDAQGNIIVAGARDARGNIIPGTQGIIPSAARGVNPATGDSTVFLRKILGSPVPDFTLSMNNEMQIGRNVQFGVLFDGRFGNEVANFSRRISEFFGSGRANETEECLTQGTTVRCPMTLNGERHNLFEAFIEDGSFVKLREASLSYRMDQPWVRRFGTEMMTIRVAGRNLYTWTDYSGIDPEINLFSANTVARGVDFATTPIPRTITVGVSLNF
jgi:TonB-dependent starch-binding outer membrane protein SusC